MAETDRQTASALLVIDMVNPLHFEGAAALFAEAVPAARRIAALTARARAANVPVIYANDNFGSWHVGFRELVDRVRTQSTQGATLIDLLRPDPAVDHYVLKPMHSAFFQTGLEFLLQHLGVTTLILTGIAAEICVFFTANDAHMRRYQVIVPSDCVASERTEDHAYALRLMARLVAADTRPSAELDLAALAGAGAARRLTED